MSYFGLIRCAWDREYGGDGSENEPRRLAGLDLPFF